MKIKKSRLKEIIKEELEASADTNAVVGRWNTLTSQQKNAVHQEASQLSGFDKYEKELDDATDKVYQLADNQIDAMESGDQAAIEKARQEWRSARKEWRAKMKEASSFIVKYYSALHKLGGVLSKEELETYKLASETMKGKAEFERGLRDPNYMIAKAMRMRKDGGSQGIK